MAIGDHTIHRIYSCSSCEAQVSFEEKVSDKWRKKCPLCKKHSLLLDRATLNISAFINTKNPTTFGSVSDINKARHEKEHGSEAPVGPKKPFWRKNKKVDFNILKNPQKYVMTGNT